MENRQALIDFLKSSDAMTSTLATEMIRSEIVANASLSLLLFVLCVGLRRSVRRINPILLTKDFDQIARIFRTRLFLSHVSFLASLYLMWQTARCIIAPRLVIAEQVTEMLNELDK